MNKQNVTIGLLSAAALLLTLAVIFVGQADQAVAGNAQSLGGDFVALPLNVRADREVLVIVDTSAERMNVYGIADNGTVDFAPALTVRLDQYFEQGRGAAPVVPR